MQCLYVLPALTFWQESWCQLGADNEKFTAMFASVRTLRGPINRVLMMSTGPTFQQAGRRSSGCHSTAVDP